MKGNRTRLFGVSIMCLGVIEQYAREIVPAEWQGLLLTGVGMGVIILREFTTTPAGKS